MTDISRVDIGNVLGLATNQFGLINAPAVKKLSEQKKQESNYDSLMGGMDNSYNGYNGDSMDTSVYDSIKDMGYYYYKPESNFGEDGSKTGDDDKKRKRWIWITSIVAFLLVVLIIIIATRKTSK